MLKEFNEKLIKVKADLQHRARLKEMVAMADDMIAERYVKLEKLKRVLIKERCDVEKLEGPTVERLLHYLIIGTSTKRLEKEQKELLIAQQNYEDCLALISALEEDRARFAREIDGLDGIDEQYANLLEEKSKIISQSNHPDARKIFDALEKYSQAQTRVENLMEALSAGRDTLTALESLSRQASNMLENFKYAKIQNIANAVRGAQQKLHAFELASRSLDGHSIRKLSRWLMFTFSDELVDSLTPDLFTPEHLSKALELAQKRRLEIEEAVNELEASLFECREDLELARLDWRTALESIG